MPNDSFRMNGHIINRNRIKRNENERKRETKKSLKSNETKKK